MGFHTFKLQLLTAEFFIEEKRIVIYRTHEFFKVLTKFILIKAIYVNIIFEKVKQKQRGTTFMSFGRAGRITRIVASPTIFRPFLKAKHIILEILDLLKSLL